MKVSAKPGADQPRQSEREEETTRRGGGGGRRSGGRLASSKLERSGLIPPLRSGPRNAARALMAFLNFLRRFLLL